MTTKPTKLAWETEVASSATDAVAPIRMKFTVPLPLYVANATIEVGRAQGAHPSCFRDSSIESTLEKEKPSTTPAGGEETGTGKVLREKTEKLCKPWRGRGSATSGADRDESARAYPSVPSRRCSSSSTSASRTSRLVS